MTRTHVTFGGFTQSCKQNACVLPDRRERKREREKEKACFTSSHAMWSRACTRNLLLPLPAIDDIALTIYWENIHRPRSSSVSSVFQRFIFFPLSLPSFFGEVPFVIARWTARDKQIGGERKSVPLFCVCCAGAAAARESIIPPALRLSHNFLFCPSVCWRSIVLLDSVLLLRRRHSAEGGERSKVNSPHTYGTHSLPTPLNIYITLDETFYIGANQWRTDWHPSNHGESHSYVTHNGFLVPPLGGKQNEERAIMKHADGRRAIAI